jgi:hypothetical protein
VPNGGRFIGQIKDDHPYADPFRPPLEALNPKLLHGLTPEQFMATRPQGEEGFMLPNSDLLWIQKPDKQDLVPMSYLDPEVKNG